MNSQSLIQSATMPPLSCWYFTSLVLFLLSLSFLLFNTGWWSKVESSKSLQEDWLGLAKTHLDLTKAHVRSKVQSSVQSLFGYSLAKCTFLLSNINYNSNWKPGGTLQIALENLATCTLSSFSDVLGRFTSQTHVGKKGSKLTKTIRSSTDSEVLLWPTHNREQC